MADTTQTLKHLLGAVDLTIKMRERRDQVKRLLGDKYAAATKDARYVVQAVADRDKKSLVEAALFICELAVREGNGGACNVVIAATVDLIEEAAAHA